MNNNQVKISLSELERLLKKIMDESHTKSEEGDLSYSKINSAAHEGLKHLDSLRQSVLF